MRATRIARGTHATHATLAAAAALAADTTICPNAEQATARRACAAGTTHARSATGTARSIRQAQATGGAARTRDPRATGTAQNGPRATRATGTTTTGTTVCAWPDRANAR